MGMEETDREWLTQFMENELSTFDAYDDDDFIEHRLTEEDQVELLEDLNFAYYAEAQEDGTICLQLPRQPQNSATEPPMGLNKKLLLTTALI